MKRLNFNFEMCVINGVETPPASAFIELSEKQFENFFLLLEVAVEKRLSSAELFIHGVQWLATTPAMESGEFIVSSCRGVALKGYPNGCNGQAIKSDWIDWETLDLLFVLGDSIGRPLEVVGSQTSSTSEPSKTSLEVSNELQLV